MYPLIIDDETENQLIRVSVFLYASSGRNEYIFFFFGVFFLGVVVKKLLEKLLSYFLSEMLTKDNFHRINYQGIAPQKKTIKVFS